MTNTINKVIQNGTEYLVGGVTSVNGQTGAVTVEPGITKIFTLADTSDLTTAQSAYDWYANGGDVLLKITSPYGNSIFTLGKISSTEMYFVRVNGNGAISSGTRLETQTIVFAISSGSVTSVSAKTNSINLSSSLPAGSTSNAQITLVI